MGDNSYKGQIKLLRELPEQTLVPHRTLFKIVHRLWTMDEDEKMEAVRLLSPRIGEMEEKLAFNAIAAFSGMDQQIISDDEFMRAVEGVVGKIEIPLSTNTLYDLLHGQMEQGGNTSRTAGALLRSVNQMRGPEQAREIIKKIGPALMINAVGIRSHCGELGVTDTVVELVKKYAAGDRDQIMEEIGKEWAEMATYFDDDYGYSEEEPTKHALDVLAREKVNLTAMIRKVNDMSGSKRKNLLTSWLLEAGANWRAVNLDGAGVGLRRIVECHVMKEKGKLHDVVDKVRVGTETKRKRPSI